MADHPSDHPEFEPGRNIAVKVPSAMFDREVVVPDAPRRPELAATSGTVVAAAIAVLVLGIFPGPLFDLATTASRSLMG